MKNIKKALLLLVVTLVVLYFIIKDDIPNILESLRSANPLFLILGIGFAFLYWLFKALALHGIVNNYKKIKRKSILKQTIITQFFHGITPFASGGQPMQVYMLKKSGIKIAHSTNIIVQNFLLYQMALITHGIIAVILNFKFNYIVNNVLLRDLTILGFTINALVGLGLLIVSFSEKFNNIVLNVLIWIFTKIKIFKDREKAIERFRNKIGEFHESAIILRQHKMIIARGYIYNMIGLLCYYLTPLFVFYSLGINISPLIVYVCCSYVSIIGSFVPIPGGSGGIEYSFLQFFGGFVTGAVLSATVILWRSITYYLAMILGGLLFTTFKGAKSK